MDGALIIDKPSGMSSFDVLRELQKKLQQKKMGYLGTLDPMATGVLVVFLGKATQLIPYFSEAEKEYITELELGKSSDTFDNTGIIQKRNDVTFADRKQLEKMLLSFLGQQWQIQPAFSAVRYKGKRAYELARAGKEVHLGKRQVIFYEVELLSYEQPFVRVRVTCSSGTYIRSFIHELGEKLGTGAMMTNLRRTRVGPFILEEAKLLDQVSAECIISPQEIISKRIDWKGRSSHEKELLLKKYNGVPIL